MIDNASFYAAKVGAGAGCAPLGLTPLAAAPLARARGIAGEAMGSGRSMSLDHRRVVSDGQRRELRRIERLA